MRKLMIGALATCIFISSSALAADQLIGVGSVILNHGDYAQSDNPACSDERQNDPAGTAIFSLFASRITGLPIGVVVPLAEAVKQYAAGQGGDFARMLNGPGGRFSSCGTVVMRVPAGTRNVSINLYAAEAGGGFLPCTQLDKGFHKCGIGWAAWYYVQRGDMLIATAKNWSGDRNGRVFRIEVRGDVWQSSHTVTQGESLWTIARAAYGNAESWLLLYKANEAKLGSQPDTLLPGMILIIPAPKGW